MIRRWRSPLEPGIATREAYGRALAELGEENPRIVVLDADLSKSTHTALFGKKFKDRFFDVGIAEANMCSMAAGLAAGGVIPLASGLPSLPKWQGFAQAQ